MRLKSASFYVAIVVATIALVFTQIYAPIWLRPLTSHLLDYPSSIPTLIQKPGHITLLSLSSPTHRLPLQLFQVPGINAVKFNQKNVVKLNSDREQKRAADARIERERAEAVQPVVAPAAAPVTTPITPTAPITPPPPTTATNLQSQVYTDLHGDCVGCFGYKYTDGTTAGTYLGNDGKPRVIDIPATKAAANQWNQAIAQKVSTLSDAEILAIAKTTSPESSCAVSDTSCQKSLIAGTVKALADQALVGKPDATKTMTIILGQIENAVAQAEFSAKISTFLDPTKSIAEITHCISAECDGIDLKSYLKTLGVTDPIKIAELVKSRNQNITNFQKDLEIIKQYSDPSVLTSDLAKSACGSDFGCVKNFERTDVLNSLNFSELASSAKTNYSINLFNMTSYKDTQEFSNLPVSTQNAITNLNTNVTNAFAAYVFEENNKAPLNEDMVERTNELALNFGKMIANNPDTINQYLNKFNQKQSLYQGLIKATGLFNYLVTEQNPVVKAQINEILIHSTIPGLSDNGQIFAWDKVDTNYKSETRQLACAEDTSLSGVCSILKTSKPSEFLPGYSPETVALWEQNQVKALATIDAKIKDQSSGYLQKLFNIKIGADILPSISFSSIATINNPLVDQKLKQAAIASATLNSSSGLNAGSRGRGPVPVNIDVNKLSPEATELANQYLDRHLVTETYKVGGGIAAGMAGFWVGMAIGGGACAATIVGLVGAPGCAIIGGIIGGASAWGASQVPLYETTATQYEQQKQDIASIFGGNQMAGAIAQSTFSNTGALGDAGGGVSVGRSITTRNNQFALYEAINTQIGGYTFAQIQASPELQAQIAIQGQILSGWEQNQQNQQKWALASLPVSMATGGLNAGVGSNLASTFVTGSLSKVGFASRQIAADVLMFGGSEVINYVQADLQFNDTQGNTSLLTTPGQVTYQLCVQEKGSSACSTQKDALLAETAANRDTMHLQSAITDTITQIGQTAMSARAASRGYTELVNQAHTNGIETAGRTVGQIQTTLETHVLQTRAASLGIPEPSKLSNSDLTYQIAQIEAYQTSHPVITPVDLDHLAQTRAILAGEKMASPKQLDAISAVEKAQTELTRAQNELSSWENARSRELSESGVTTDATIKGLAHAQKTLADAAVAHESAKSVLANAINPSTTISTEKLGELLTSNKVIQTEENGKPRLGFDSSHTPSAEEITVLVHVNNLLSTMEETSGFPALRPKQVDAVRQSLDLLASQQAAKSSNPDSLLLDVRNKPGVNPDAKTGEGKNTVIVPLLEKIAMDGGNLTLHLAPEANMAGNRQTIKNLSGFYDTDIYVAVNEKNAAGAVTDRYFTDLAGSRIPTDTVLARVQAEGKAPMILSDADTAMFALNDVVKIEQGLAKPDSMSEVWSKIWNAKPTITADEVGTLAGHWQSNLGDPIALNKLSSSQAALYLNNGKEVLSIYRATGELEIIQQARRGELNLEKNLANQSLKPLADPQKNQIIDIAIDQARTDTKAPKTLLAELELIQSLPDINEKRQAFDTLRKLTPIELDATYGKNAGHAIAIANAYNDAIYSRLSIIAGIAGNDFRDVAGTLGTTIELANSKTISGQQYSEAMLKLALQDEGGRALNIDVHKLVPLEDLAINTRAISVDLDSMFDRAGSMIGYDATDRLATAKTGLQAVYDSTPLQKPKSVTLTQTLDETAAATGRLVRNQFDNGKTALVIETNVDSYSLDEATSAHTAAALKELKPGENLYLALDNGDGSYQLYKINGPDRGEWQLITDSPKSAEELYSASRTAIDADPGSNRLLALFENKARGENFKPADRLAPDIKESIVIGNPETSISDTVQQAAGRVRTNSTDPAADYHFVAYVAGEDTFNQLNSVNTTKPQDLPGIILSHLEQNQARTEGYLSLERNIKTINDRQIGNLITELYKDTPTNPKLASQLAELENQIKNSGLAFATTPAEENTANALHDQYLFTRGRLDNILTIAKQNGISTNRISSLRTTFNLGETSLSLNDFSSMLSHSFNSDSQSGYHQALAANIGSFQNVPETYLAGSPTQPVKTIASALQTPASTSLITRISSWFQDRLPSLAYPTTSTFHLPTTTIRLPILNNQPITNIINLPSFDHLSFDTTNGPIIIYKASDRLYIRPVNSNEPIEITSPSQALEYLPNPASTTHIILNGEDLALPSYRLPATPTTVPIVKEQVNLTNVGLVEQAESLGTILAKPFIHIVPQTKPTTQPKVTIAVGVTQQIKNLLAKPIDQPSVPQPQAIPPQPLTTTQLAQVTLISQYAQILEDDLTPPVGNNPVTGQPYTTQEELDYALDLARTQFLNNITAENQTAIDETINSIVSAVNAELQKDNRLLDQLILKEYIVSLIKLPSKLETTVTFDPKIKDRITEQILNSILDEANKIIATKLEGSRKSMKQEEVDVLSDIEANILSATKPVLYSNRYYTMTQIQAIARQILGINAPQVSDAEATSAFRKLAQLFHPDINRSAIAENIFKALNESQQLARSSHIFKHTTTLDGITYVESEEASAIKLLLGEIYHANKVSSKPKPQTQVKDYWTSNVTFGRSSTSHVVFGQGAQQVSRTHFEVGYDIDGYYINNLSDSSPTYLNNKKMRIGEDRTLHHLDTITAGDQEFYVRITENGIEFWNKQSQTTFRLSAKDGSVTTTVRPKTEEKVYQTDQSPYTANVSAYPGVGTALDFGNKYLNREKGNGESMEDVALFYPNPNPETNALFGKGLSILADGAGSSGMGYLVSRLIQDRAGQIFYSRQEGDISERLRSTIFQLNDEVATLKTKLIDQGIDEVQLEQIASTLELVVIVNDEAYIAHVGDSETWLVRNNKAFILTHDHSDVGAMLDNGDLTVVEAGYHPSNNKINAALQGKDDIYDNHKHEILKVKLRPGDVLLSASDGMIDVYRRANALYHQRLEESNSQEGKALASSVHAEDTAQVIAQTLLNSVLFFAKDQKNSLGQPRKLDNISIQVIKYDDLGNFEKETAQAPQALAIGSRLFSGANSLQVFSKVDDSTVKLAYSIGQVIVQAKPTFWSFLKLSDYTKIASGRTVDVKIGGEIILGNTVYIFRGFNADGAIIELRNSQNFSQPPKQESPNNLGAFSDGFKLFNNLSISIANLTKQLIHPLPPAIQKYINSAPKGAKIDPSQITDIKDEGNGKYSFVYNGTRYGVDATGYPYAGGVPVDEQVMLNLTAQTEERILSAGVLSSFKENNRYEYYQFSQVQTIARKIFDVGENATQDEIKQAYRNTIRLFSPDINKNPNAEIIFKTINDAYTILRTDKILYDTKTINGNIAIETTEISAMRELFDPEYQVSPQSQSNTAQSKKNIWPREITLGRNERADIPLNFANLKMSARHFSLGRDEDGYYIIDLGSTNGTFINGQRISSKTYLKKGDTITITADEVFAVNNVDSGLELIYKRNKDILYFDANTGAFTLKKNVAISPVWPKEIIFGRNSATADIVNTDEYTSRNHFSLGHDSKGYYIKDLSSTTGTFINGDEVKTNEKTYLKDKDIITNNHALNYEINLSDNGVVLFNNTKKETLQFDPSTGALITPVWPKEIIFGRNSATADIKYPNFEYMSGKHFSLGHDSLGYYIIDLNSTNGTFLNGNIIAPQTKKYLKIGDTISSHNNKSFNFSVKITDSNLTLHDNISNKSLSFDQTTGTVKTTSSRGCSSCDVVIPQIVGEAIEANTETAINTILAKHLDHTYEHSHLQAAVMGILLYRKAEITGQSIDYQMSAEYFRNAQTLLNAFGSIEAGTNELSLPPGLSRLHQTIQAVYQTLPVQDTVQAVMIDEHQSALKSAENLAAQSAKDAPQQSAPLTIVARQAQSLRLWLNQKYGDLTGREVPATTPQTSIIPLGRKLGQWIKKIFPFTESGQYVTPIGILNTLNLPSHSFAEARSITTRVQEWWGRQYQNYKINQWSSRVGEALTDTQKDKVINTLKAESDGNKLISILVSHRTPQIYLSELRFPDEDNKVTALIQVVTLARTIQIAQPKTDTHDLLNELLNQYSNIKWDKIQPYFTQLSSIKTSSNAHVSAELLKRLSNSDLNLETAIPQISSLSQLYADTSRKADWNLLYLLGDEPSQSTLDTLYTNINFVGHILRSIPPQNSRNKVIEDNTLAVTIHDIAESSNPDNTFLQNSNKIDELLTLSRKFNRRSQYHYSEEIMAAGLKSPNLTNYLNQLNNLSDQDFAKLISTFDKTHNLGDLIVTKKTKTNFDENIVETIHVITLNDDPTHSFDFINNLISHASKLERDSSDQKYIFLQTLKLIGTNNFVPDRILKVFDQLIADPNASARRTYPKMLKIWDSMNDDKQFTAWYDSIKYSKNFTYIVDLAAIQPSLTNEITIAINSLSTNPTAKISDLLKYNWDVVARDNSPSVTPQNIIELNNNIQILQQVVADYPGDTGKYIIESILTIDNPSELVSEMTKRPDVFRPLFLATDQLGDITSKLKTISTNENISRGIQQVRQTNLRQKLTRLSVKEDILAKPLTLSGSLTYKLIQILDLYKSKKVSYENLPQLSDFISNLFSKISSEQLLYLSHYSQDNPTFLIFLASFRNELLPYLSRIYSTAQEYQVADAIVVDLFFTPASSYPELWNANYLTYLSNTPNTSKAELASKIISDLTTNKQIEPAWGILQQQNVDQLIATLPSEQQQFWQTFRDYPLLRKRWTEPGGIEFFYSLSANQVKIYTALAEKIEESPVAFIQKIKESLIAQLLMVNDPVGTYENIDRTLTHNNLPEFIKLIKVFNYLYPKNILNPKISFRSSPTIQAQKSDGMRRLILQLDLFHAAVESGNRNLENYLTLFSNYGNLVDQFMQGKELSPQETNQVITFITKMDALYRSSNLTRIRSGLDLDLQQTSNQEYLRTFIQNTLYADLDITRNTSLVGKIEELFLHNTGYSSSKDIVSHMQDLRAQTTSRNLAYASTHPQLTLDTGDLTKSMITTPKTGTILSILENGPRATELMGDLADNDSTPLDTDLSMITVADAQAGYQAAIEKSGADTTYGRLIFVTKNIPGRFYRSDLGESSQKGQFELFITGVVDLERHVGIRGAYPSSYFDAIINNGFTESELDTLYQSIVLNGFYIPVYSKERGLIFTPQMYSDRLKFFTGVHEQSLQINTLAPQDPFTKLIRQNQLNPDPITNAQDIERVETPVRIRIKEVLSSLGINLSDDPSSANLTDALLINIGSSGRGTNLPKDYDFDYSLIFNRQDYKKAAALTAALRNIFPHNSETGSSLNQLRLSQVNMSETSETIDLDVGIVTREDSLLYSSNQAVSDRLNSLSSVDRQQAIANVLLTKKLLKDGHAYKAYEDGGFGGIGVENWIFSNNGNIRQAFETFWQASHDIGGTELTIDEFKKNYPIYDPGTNLRNQSFDNYSLKLTDNGYQNMLKVIDQYLYRPSTTINSFLPMPALTSLGVTSGHSLLSAISAIPTVALIPDLNHTLIYNVKTWVENLHFLPAYLSNLAQQLDDRINPRTNCLTASLNIIPRAYASSSMISSTCPLWERALVQSIATLEKIITPVFPKITNSIGKKIPLIPSQCGQDKQACCDSQSRKCEWGFAESQWGDSCQCKEVATNDNYCLGNELHSSSDAMGIIQTCSNGCVNGYCAVVKGSSCSAQEDQSVRPNSTSKDNYLFCNQGIWDSIAGNHKIIFNNCSYISSNAHLKALLPIQDYIFPNSDLEITCGTNAGLTTDYRKTSSGYISTISLQCDPVQNPTDCATALTHELSHAWILINNQRNIFARISLFLKLDPQLSYRGDNKAFNEAIGAQLFEKDPDNRDNSIYSYTQEIPVDDDKYGSFIEYKDGIGYSHTGGYEAFALANGRYVYDGKYLHDNYPIQYNWLKDNIYQGHEFYTNTDKE